MSPPKGEGCHWSPCESGVSVHGMETRNRDTSPHVLVIGGGLGGLCLAQGLKKGGVSVAVYERDAGPSHQTSEGYSLQINAHGNGALQACLPPELWTVYLETTARPVAGICFTTSQLRRL